MKHDRAKLTEILPDVNFGVSVAEQDTILESARVETSVFSDLWADRVDLVPGTKGSGKSALYRIFVEFLPQVLLQHRRVVVAHGVQSVGDNVFHAFKEQFESLDEQQFINFWCVYLVSLAHEQFIKNPEYKQHIASATKEIVTVHRILGKRCAAAATGSR